MMDQIGTGPGDGSFPGSEGGGGIPRVLLVGQGQSEMGSLRGQLEALGYPLVCCGGGEEAPGLVRSGAADLVIVDVTSPGVEGVRACRLIKEARAPGIPVLLATLRVDRETRVMGAHVGADGFLNKPIEADELRLQLGLVYQNCRLTTELQEENSRTEELNARLMAAQAALDTELHLAHRLQGSLLPQELPKYSKVAFAAGLRPSGAVSGDFYDVFRLDEHHAGFYVADAIGHGVPAALLTIFVKKGIRTKEIAGHSYRLLRPGEVLEHLNQDIIEAELSDNPFVTMFYGCIDLETRQLEYATGGHPWPLLLNRHGKTEMVESEGPLLGVFRSEFSTSSMTLEKGDRLVVYSDGVEDARGTGGVLGLDWMRILYQKHALLELEEQVTRVMDGLVGPMGHLRDDTTMLALQAIG